MKILTSFLFTILFFVLSSCFGVNMTNLSTTREPVGSDSCLITPRQQLQNWALRDKTEETRTHQPTTENHYLLSTTNLIYEFRDQAGNRRFEISSSIRSYNQPINWSEKLDSSFYENNLVSINLKFIEMGQEMQSVCKKEVADRKYLSFGCQIKAKYTTHMLTIFASGSSSVAEVDIEDFLNPILHDFNSCILGLEKNNEFQEK